MRSGSAEFLMGVVVAARAQGGGPTGRGSVYTIRSPQGEDYSCDYLEIVTVGFRTLKVGDRVRFEPVGDELSERLARHVIKIDQPTWDELYGPTTSPAVARSESSVEGD